MKTVLLVEDNEDDVFFMETAVQEHRMRVNLRIARTGDEAVDYLSGRGNYTNREAFPLPNVVITDIKMPGKTGHELLQWVRSHETLHRLPVLMLSSSNQAVDVNLAYDYGANSYLHKPMAHQELQETVGMAINYWLKANVPPQPE
ncbi:MAG: response regulator with CheY-like receiver domain and winged-helix DNA-binding domain [Pedosphaera sp.]|nr:response regulator with CheY-like receiver domain and winged-helix DNA-binding domain [Pedosphaera sp.]